MSFIAPQSPAAFEPRSAAMRALVERGFVHQCTDLCGLDDAFAESTVPVYIGFDATADSLHVGHLVPIMALRLLQRTGHKPIVLIGGGTTRIGDPTLRNEARPLLDPEQIEINKEGIRRSFEPFLSFGDGPTDAVMVDNADWLDDARWIDVLRDIGRHFTVGRMLALETVKHRLDRQDPVSFLEFNYPILQACDFVELDRRFGCRAQMGGSDQWGNILGGVDLVRRIGRQDVFGLTAPLLTNAAGVKMGKSIAGAVWLNADRLSPFDFWQFWRNTEDERVAVYLRLFTDQPLAEVARLTGPGADINAAKIALADAVTTLAHGVGAAALPRVPVPAGITIVEAMVAAGLARSKGEARRLIAGGGARLDDQVVTVGEQQLSASVHAVRLSAGRKRHVLVRVG